MVAIIHTGTPKLPPAVGASPERTTVGNTFSRDTLTKADKLEIAYVRDAAAVEPATLAKKVSDEILSRPPGSLSRKVVSRPSRDPNAKKTIAVSPGRHIKSQEPKKSKNVDRRKATVDLRACRRPEGFAGLLRVLNLSPGCDS